jgi:hypothetical protein
MKDKYPNLENSEPNLWRTPDLYLAGFLKAKGLIFSGVEREGRRAFFLFPQTPLLEEFIEDFYNGGVVSALGYKESLRTLREIIYSGGRP